MPKLSFKRFKTWFASLKLKAKKVKSQAIHHSTTVPKGVPFLNLPHFSRNGILRHLDFFELIQLALLSRKSRAIVKPILAHAKEFTVNFGRYSNQISISTGEGAYELSFENADRILDLFDFPDTILTINTDKQLSTIIEFVRKHLDCVKLIRFLTPVFYPDLVQLVNSVRGSGEVKIEVHGKFNFICTGDEVQIDNPHSFFIPHIWRLNFSIVNVTSSDVFLNLSDWIYGRIPSTELKLLIVWLKFSEDLDTMMSNAGVVESNERWIHPFYGPINKSYKVERVDNTKKATLFEYRDSLYRMMVMEIESCVPKSFVF